MEEIQQRHEDDDVRVYREEVEYAAAGQNMRLSGKKQLGMLAAIKEETKNSVSHSRTHAK